MRKKVASAFKNPAIRLVAAALLAGTAAGCSSDATRFDTLYSSVDNLTTASVSHAQILPGGTAPVPSADLNNVASMSEPSDLADPLSQPMPPAPGNGNYYGSAARSSVVRSASIAPVQEEDLGPAAPMPVATPQTTGSIPHSSTRKIRMIKGPAPVSAASVKSKVASEKNKQVASLGAKRQMPNVPVPLPEPRYQQAIVPTAPKLEKKKFETASREGDASGLYKVSPGDSLGAIARKNGTTVRALRAANGLKSDNIRIGQTLKIPGGSGAAMASVKMSKADNVKTASIPAKKVQKVSAPAKKVPVVTAKESVSAVTNTKVASVAPAETGIGKYRWPVTGAIIAGFGANVDGQRNDGIDISVPEGTPVKAAENGVVIYAGSGLEKLGNTVLLRHSDGTVTVYAHVKKMDVSRGEQVKRGQVIAASGMSGNASRPKLHFEVRKNSAPVNPMTFLE